MMKIEETPIPGVKVVRSSPFEDERGRFARLFCEKELAPLLGERRIVQINHSMTMEKGALRGMHYQNPPHAEMKMIRCLRGKVWDVALDLRRGSPTFLRWYGTELSPDHFNMMVIPEGCAHGFQVIEPASELLYLHTAFYEKSAEGAVKYDDPAAGISWPLPVTDLSQRDREHLPLAQSFSGVAL